MKFSARLTALACGFAAVLAATLIPACKTGGPARPTPIPPAVPAFPPSTAAWRICLDPGHGGPWPGTTSAHNGLRECDVNLRVAMKVKSLLEASGVEVVMTRDTDIAVDPQSLSADLGARARLANVSGADVFVSIHHNADIVKESGKDDIEVYYKLGDDGASLDLAQQFITVLGSTIRASATAKRLLPGNYKVLRECDLPCVLLETAYLTDRNMAEFLSTETGINAEADAIAKGLLAYIGLNPPRRCVIAELPASRFDQPDIAVHMDDGGPVDLTTIQCTVNETAIQGQAAATAKGFRWSFGEPLPNGTHRVSMSYKNVRGAAGTVSGSIAVNRVPQTIVTRQIPAQAPRTGMAEVLIEVQPLDVFGLTVADGTAVALDSGATATVQHGRARFRVPTATAGDALAVHCANVSARHSMVYGPEPRVHAFVVDAITERPVEGVTAAVQGAPFSVSTPDGWIALPRSSALELARSGYEPLAAGMVRDGATLRLKPRDAGTLIGRRIVIDAMHGGRDPGMIGPTGLRSSDIALDVARRLARELGERGASVFLTRSGDTEHTEADRVLRAEQFKPEVLIAITFGSGDTTLRLLGPDGFQIPAGPAFAAHYPASANGSRLAQGMAAAAGTRNVHASVNYLVQQMSCPVVLVQPARITDAGAEQRLRSVNYQRDTAIQLANAVAAWSRTHANR